MEERDVMIGQLQRSKAGVCQNYDDLKRQLEEESKVTQNTGLNPCSQLLDRYPELNP